MIDYSKIWESINIESQNPKRTQVARKIPPKGVVTIFLASDVKKMIRLMYVKLSESAEIRTDELPHFKGLDITRGLTSIGEFHNETFLVFTQTIPDTENIFESIISDICDRINCIRHDSLLKQVLSGALNEWKIFFEKYENRLMPISKQKGLFGELVFLKDYVLGKYSPEQAIDFWTGSSFTNHDFQINDLAVEIKTTSSKQHKKFNVASEKQLDTSGLEHLYLILFSILIHSNQTRQSIPKLVDEISALLSGNPAAYFKFQNKVAKYGYDRKTKESYRTSFSVKSITAFEVRENFPRLTEHNLPDGVGDLRYSVIVSACRPFLIKTKIHDLL